MQNNPLLKTFEYAINTLPDYYNEDVKFFDIAANLSHQNFQGLYNDKKYHEEDLEEVIQRCQYYRVDKLLVVGGYLEDIDRCREIVKDMVGGWTTVGIHPCKAGEVFKNNGSVENHFKEMCELIDSLGEKCLAIGECGLDYALLSYADKETQLKVFPLHFDLAEKYNLPMYFHARDCHPDFINILKDNREKFPTGVVHCYTGGLEEMLEYVKLGLYIGVAGVSMATEEAIEVVKQIPIDKILLETDAPYCRILKKSPCFKYVHTEWKMKTKKKQKPGFLVKERNEPIRIIEVLQAVAKIKGIDEEELAIIAYENSCRLFNIDIEQ